MNYPGWLIGATLIIGSRVLGATLYVSADSPSPAAPYASWSTAAHTIQPAVDAATPGDAVLVARGVYANESGQVVAPSAETNRVRVRAQVQLVSAEGPDVTSIAGNGMRGVYLEDGARLCGFTVSNGVASSGGGVWCAGAAAVISNCYVVGNSAGDGGGIYGGSVRMCKITGNSATSGAGVNGSDVANSELTGNHADLGLNTYGGGAYDSTLVNCLIAENTALPPWDYDGYGAGACRSTLYYCTVVRNKSTWWWSVQWPGLYECAAVNCIEFGNYVQYEPPARDAAFVDDANGDFRLLPGSRYIDAATNVIDVVVDLPGHPRVLDGDGDGISRPDLGCYEYGYFLHVAPTGASVYPYTNWATAATSIQTAVDAAMPGDCVLLAPGVYTGAMCSADASNLVSISKAITLCAAATNPADTVLDGGGARRGILMTAPAMIRGLTVRNGRVDAGGGGIAASAGGSISRCMIMGNTAANGHGGGINIVGGTVRNCLLAGNVATNAANDRDGGGIFVYGGTVEFCTVADNRCGRNGPGIYIDRRANTDSAVRQAIVYFNSSTGSLHEIVAGNAGGSGTVILSSVCTPSFEEGFDIRAEDPLFHDRPTGDYHLGVDSPCIDRGGEMSVLLDLDGLPRGMDGDANGSTDVADASDLGAYEFQRHDIHYVTLSGSTPFSFVYARPVPPFGGWRTAALTIQEAVDAAADGDTVLVYDGVYSSGGRPATGSTLTNRVCVEKGVAVRSVHGPAVTEIVGVSPCGPSAVRGVYLATNATLAGFCIRNSATFEYVGIYSGADQDGGGIYCMEASPYDRTWPSASIDNCLVVSNEAGHNGGGIYGGRITASPVLSNSGVGAGGIYGATAWRCRISGNTSRLSHGGGGEYSDLAECIVTRNGCWNDGGGTRSCHLTNCVVAFNYAGETDGGVSEGSARNSIIVSNNSSWGSLDGSGAVEFSCTSIGGANNITNEPIFVDASIDDFRLLPGSPCIDAGNNVYVAGSMDYAGNLRIVNGAVDIGAHEYTDSAVADADGDGMPDGWEVTYFSGHREPGGDPDADGLSNWAEWRAGTDPGLSDSVFAVKTLSGTAGEGMTIQWPGAAARFYTVSVSTNLRTGSFVVLSDTVRGTPPMNTYTDLTATAAARYYRVRVNP